MSIAFLFCFSTPIIFHKTVVPAKLVSMSDSFFKVRPGYQFGSTSGSSGCFSVYFWLWKGGGAPSGWVCKETKVDPAIGFSELILAGLRRFRHRGPRSPPEKFFPTFGQGKMKNLERFKQEIAIMKMMDLRSYGCGGENCFGCDPILVGIGAFTTHFRLHFGGFGAFTTHFRLAFLVVGMNSLAANRF